MPQQNYQRNQNGIRLDLTGGLNTMLPPDLMQQGFPYLQNVRRNLAGRAIARPALGGNILPNTIPNPTSMILMNDPYMVSPPAITPTTYVLIIGTDAGELVFFAASTVGANGLVWGLSGLPLSFVVFRPNATPQPWCYVADPSMQVIIPAYPASIYGNPIAGMVKVRSDGTVYKTGIAEPQVAPGLSVSGNPGSSPNWVTYRYVYRSPVTGALSNPSPECPALIVPQGTSAGTTNAGSSPHVAYNQSHYEVNPEVYSELRTSGGVGDGTLLDYIIATGLPLSGVIPDNVQIQGIEVTLNFWSQNSGGGNGLIANVSLFYQNNLLGMAKSPGVSNSHVPADYTYGNQSDSWGTVLTPDIVQDPTFGFGFQIEAVQAGGTNRSFFQTLSITIYYASQNANILATPSPDPQVGLVDFYRSDQGLDNFTYVGTIPNSTAATQGLNDTLSDLAIAGNQILQFDNYEPFPSIDLPHSGGVTVGANGVITHTSGDLFNVRWLPGNIILLGSPGNPAQIAWTLYNRPSSPTQLRVYTSILDPTTGFPSFSYPPTGAGQTYSISEATLAAQPSPAIWGPTPENQGSFYFGLDPLNPGDLLWSKGNNFDSAPDTNRQFVTSPSEVLMNGAITSELSTVFSTERFWLIYPNFADAVATVTGVAGPQWTLIQAQATRGLYMRYALAALGSMIAYRAKDCIAVSMGGGPEQSITDDIYNLFPHSGFTPQPVTIAGNTVYPPDDTRPSRQTLALTPSYLFYNYQDTTGTPRTLVYDLQAKGWTVDVYTFPVNLHLWTVGAPARLLTGCSDGTVRLMGGGGEAATAVIATRCENGGEARAPKRVGDVFFRAGLQSGTPVALQFWQTQFTRQLTGFSPVSLVGSGTGVITYYTVDFTAGFGEDVDDIGAVLSWPLASSNIFDLWQPGWIPLPEVVQDRPSDWDDGGSTQNKFVQGLLLECNTFGVAKNFQVESDDGVLHTPVEVPVTQNGQAVRSFTFNPPFTAHMIRIISTDGVKWQFGPSGGWDLSWMVQPYPESSTVWTTQASSLGLLGWCFVYQINLAYVSTAPVTLTVTTDQGAFALTYPPSTGGTNAPSKILLKCPRNKFKVVSFSATSTTKFSLWKDLCEVWIRSWGESSELHKLSPFGGDSSPAATI